MSLNSICPLLLQSVNGRVFESLMVEYFTDALMVATSRSVAVPVAAGLNGEEEMLCVMSVGMLP